MTREEIKSGLSAFATHFSPFSEESKLILGAFEVLEQETCEDCVSREFMYKLGAKCIAVRNENDVLVAIASIESLPSAIPKQKTGHWIRVTDKTGHLVWECDKCGWQQRFNTNFCPDCGVKMESEDKE